MSASGLQKRIQQTGLPPLPDKPNFSVPIKSGKKSRCKDYGALEWNEFFDEKLTVAVDDKRSFNVYRKGSGVPLLLLLHGGGYSGLTWACFAEEISQRLDCTVLAPDLRGHGDSSVEFAEDFSTEAQTKDIGDIMVKLYGEEQPPTFVIGHSMGGALAVHATHAGLIRNPIALLVIDVVEGSALEALNSMRSFLLSRPSSFATVEAAVEWCIRSGTVRSLRSARISMPAQIQLTQGTTDDRSNDLSEVAEEEEAEETAPSVADRWTWRIDLFKSEPYWKGWFRGLSDKFLSVPVPKLLLLAGVDRLDKELTVGQMQGKFQVLVLPKVGHAVHEDSPDRVADAITTFCVRHKFAQAKGDFKPVYPGC